MAVWAALLVIAGIAGPVFEDDVSWLSGAVALVFAAAVIAALVMRKRAPILAGWLLVLGVAVPGILAFWLFLIPTAVAAVILITGHTTREVSYWPRETASPEQT